MTRLPKIPRKLWQEILAARRRSDRLYIELVDFGDEIGVHLKPTRLNAILNRAIHPADKPYPCGPE